VQIASGAVKVFVIDGLRPVNHQHNYWQVFGVWRLAQLKF